MADDDDYNPQLYHHGSGSMIPNSGNGNPVGVVGMGDDATIQYAIMPGMSGDLAIDHHELLLDSNGNPVGGHSSIVSASPTARKSQPRRKNNSSSTPI